ncbi:MAG: serine/threonine protein kinase [Ruminococcus sp.]|jgi:serine/threonine protein kinase|nr:serine/threonine protein kinase [Ruminococcus sp.]
MVENSATDYPDALPAGTVLSGKFRIDGVLGAGGFGLTYKGYDTEIEREIAIKEYFPRQLSVRANDGMTVRSYKGSLSSRYNDGLNKFIHEARRTAKFGKNPGVVWVISYFEANGTAYIVMEFVEGRSLSSLLEERKTLSEPETLTLLKPVILAVRELHKNHLIHRDIAPDNIMIQKDGSTKLIDFGASADFSEEASDNSELVIKPGYAPIEQYDRSRKTQGPWTDVYALCATIYKCISGKTIPEALVRVRSKNALEKLPESINCRDIIDKGLQVMHEERLQSVDALIKAFYHEKRKLDFIIPISIAAGALVVAGVIVFLLSILSPEPTATPQTVTTTAETVTVTSVEASAYSGAYEYDDYREKYEADIKNPEDAEINDMNHMCIINSANSFRVVDIGMRNLNGEAAVLLIQADIFGRDVTVDLLDFYVHYETSDGNSGFAEIIPTRSIDAEGNTLAFPLKIADGKTVVFGFEVPVKTNSIDFVFSGIDDDLSEELSGENGASVIVRTPVELTE